MLLLSLLPLLLIVWWWMETINGLVCKRDSTIAIHIFPLHTLLVADIESWLCFACYLYDPIHSPTLCNLRPQRNGNNVFCMHFPQEKKHKGHQKKWKETGYVVSVYSQYALFEWDVIYIGRNCRKSSSWIVFNNVYAPYREMIARNGRNWRKIQTKNCIHFHLRHNWT